MVGSSSSSVPEVTCHGVGKGPPCQSLVVGGTGEGAVQFEGKKFRLSKILSWLQNTAVNITSFAKVRVSVIIINSCNF